MADSIVPEPAVQLKVGNRRLGAMPTMSRGAGFEIGRRHQGAARPMHDLTLL